MDWELFNKMHGFDTNAGGRQKPQRFTGDDTEKENSTNVEGRNMMEEKKNTNRDDLSGSIESEKKELSSSKIIEIIENNGRIAKQPPKDIPFPMDNIQNGADENLVRTQVRTSDDCPASPSSDVVDSDNRGDRGLWIKLECDFSVKGKINRDTIEKNKSLIKEFLNGVRDNCSIEPGNVGVQLNATINILPTAPEKVRLFKSSVPSQALSFSPVFEELGIDSVEYREGYIFLRGVPQKDYESGIDIRLVIRYHDFVILSDGAEAIATVNARTDISLPFVINKRPEDMWEDKDPSSDEPYQKDKSACRALNLNGTGKVILAASQRGRSHAHNGTFRDDDYAFKYDEQSGWCYLAVADGAGSAKFSRQGSRIACNGIVDAAHSVFDASGLNTIGQNNALIARLIDGNIEESEVRDELFYTQIHKAVHSTWTMIHDEAKKNGAQIRDYHTTLLFAAIKKLRDRWLIVTYWVGDGGLVILNPNNTESVLLMGQPDTGEYAGQTKFFTMTNEIEEEPIKKRIHIAVVKDYEEIFMMTDGVTDPFFPAEENIGDPEYWRRFVKEIIPKEFPGVFEKGLSIDERAEALLKGLSFYSKGNHDDRTVLIVTKEE